MSQRMARDLMSQQITREGVNDSTDVEVVRDLLAIDLRTRRREEEEGGDLISQQGPKERQCVAQQPTLD